MTSQDELPKDWNSILAMDHMQATGPSGHNIRGRKVDAIHDFMQTNEIDSSRFETRDSNGDGILKWPAQVGKQKKQINDMIGHVNSELDRRRRGSTKGDGRDEFSTSTQESPI